jgi:hypothetical protein
MKKPSATTRAPRAIRAQDLTAVTGGLGIDVPSSVDNQQVDRAGFLDSGPSDANRVIERHELPGNQGAFWLS